MSNLKIRHSKQDKYHKEVIYQSDIEINQLSFYFENGNNWHFEIGRNATESDLLYRLLGVVELIKKTIEEKRDADND